MFLKIYSYFTLALLSKKYIKLKLITLTLLIFWGTTIHSDINVISKIETGTYIPHIPLQILAIKKLPIPKTNEDYAFLQSIGNKCSIVVGSFSQIPRKITIYEDNNIDGKVDLVFTWYVDKDVYEKELFPNKVCPPDKFAKMKNDIFEGIRNEILPNNEGFNELKTLIRESKYIEKWKNGFVISNYTSDGESQKKMNFTFSNNGNQGVDLVFTFSYIIVGNKRIRPVIENSIYCKNSFDPFVIDKVRMISDLARKNYVSR